ncbi:hypothetical protein AAE478_009531 [Parahypoxylon ruwenzoriense]
MATHLAASPTAFPAHLGIQYVPSMGGCVLDMAQFQGAGFFDTCGVMHIRMQGDRYFKLDAHSSPDTICVTPTKPAMVAPEPYREKYFRPSRPADPPLRTQESVNGPAPRPNAVAGVGEKKPGYPAAPAGHRGGENGPDRSPKMSNNHQDQDPPPTHTLARPIVQQAISTFTTCTSGRPQVSHLLALPASPAATPTPVLSAHGGCKAIHCSTRTGLSTITIFSTFVTSSPLPPQSSQAPPPIKVPEPSAPPQIAPNKPVVVAPPPPAHPPPPAYCGTTYVKMDVTRIQTLDQHDVDLYLDLVDRGGGAGPDSHDSHLHQHQHHETKVVRAELEHSFRVRCGVPIRGLPGGRDVLVTAGSQTTCLEECEKRALGRARSGEVAECIGAAWHRSLRRDNCRFWMGGRHEFLPVEERLGPADGAGEVGDWDLVYL